MHEIMGGHFNGFDLDPAQTEVLGYDASIQFSTAPKDRGAIPKAVSMPFARTQNFDADLKPWISKDTIYPAGCNSVDDGSRAADDCVTAHPGMRPLRQVGYRGEEVWLKGRQIMTPVANQADCAVSLPDKLELDLGNDDSVAYFPTSRTLYLLNLREEPGVLYVSKGCQSFERVDYSAHIKRAKNSCPVSLHVYDIVPGKNALLPALLIESCRNIKGVFDLDAGLFKLTPHQDALFFWGNDGNRVALTMEQKQDWDEKARSKFTFVAKVFDVDTGEVEWLTSSYRPKMQMSFGFWGWLFNW
ncbi:hypothetical protein ACO0LF_30650 [Undibacterium sp. Di27W]|uniref:hypothetical protein n=1 Tax=Undibacterium sp. Di27W TaxID=3413036 RepID=UPI003BF33CE4